MLRHLRPQIALAIVGLVAIGLVLYAVSRQALAQRPARGGTLVEAVVGPPATFNPIFAVSGVETDVARLMFAGLTRVDSTGQVVPDLAERWSVSDDGLTYTFKLRDDAVWHDGQPVTAEDVVYTASVAAADLPQKVPMAAAWERARVEAVDRETVRFTLQEPYAPFLHATVLGLLPAHLLVDVKPEQLLVHRFSTLEPIGAGPYLLEQPGGAGMDEIRLQRFESHWANDGIRPYLDEIVFRIHSSRASAVESLVQRQVQAMGDVPAEAFPALSEDARLYTVTRPSQTLVYLNPGNSLLADATVRSALSLAANRAAIVDEILDGQGIPAASPIAPGSWAYDPSIAAPEYRPAAAADMLEKAGWIDSDGDDIRDKDGRNLTFSLQTTTDPQMVGIAERLRDDWARIGVDAQVQPLGQQAAVGNLNARAFDALLFGWEHAQYDPDPYPLWHSSQADGGQNFAGWRDAAADDLMARARQALPDQMEQRAALYREFQRRFAEAQPALLLFHPTYTYAVVDRSIGGIQLPQLLVEPGDRFTTLPAWYARSERIMRGLERGATRRSTPTAREGD